MAISALVKGIVGDGENKKQTGANMAQKMLPSSSMKEPASVSPVQKSGAIVKVKDSQIVQARPVRVDNKKEDIADTGINPLDAAFAGLGGAINSLRSVIGEKFKFEKKDNQQKARKRENLLRFLKNKGLALVGGAIGVAKAIDEKLGFFEKMKKFFVNVLLGGIVVYISKNWQKLVDWWEETKKELEPFFKNLKKWVLDPLFKFVKWVGSEGIKLTKKVLSYPPIQDSIDAISEKLKEFTGLDMDLKNAINALPKEFGGGSSAPPAVQPTEDMGRSGSLFDLISKAEGGVNSVNRGNAGDTPGGAKSVLGKNLTDMTVDEVHTNQYGYGGDLFAVGKYQIIPKTMVGFIRYLRSKGIDTSKQKFDERTQDMFRNYMLESKRAKVGKFISGKSINTFKDYSELETAQLELAAEFASVGVPRDMKAGEYAPGVPKTDIKAGSSLYAGTGNNRASITPQKTADALMYSRQQGSAASRPPAAQPQAGQSRVSSDILQFRQFRKSQFGASAERKPTATGEYYQIREMGVYGSGNYNISPLADDTSYEIELHKGAGHHENRAFDIPVPNSSREGDMVNEFWKSRGYKTIWRSSGHFDHVHVEVPKEKAAEFFKVISGSDVKPSKPPAAETITPDQTPRRVTVPVPVPQPQVSVPSPSSASPSGGSGVSERTVVNSSFRSRFHAAMWAQ